MARSWPLRESSGTDLTPLRNVWLQSGSLDELLRDPKGKDPSSLLRGTYFSRRARQGVQTADGSHPAPGSRMLPSILF